MPRFGWRMKAVGAALLSLGLSAVGFESIARANPWHAHGGHGHAHYGHGYGYYGPGYGLGGVGLSIGGAGFGLNIQSGYRSYGWGGLYPNYYQPGYYAPVNPYAGFYGPGVAGVGYTNWNSAPPFSMVQIGGLNIGYGAVGGVYGPPAPGAGYVWPAAAWGGNAAPAYGPVPVYGAAANAPAPAPTPFNNQVLREWMPQNGAQPGGPALNGADLLAMPAQPVQPQVIEGLPRVSNLEAKRKSIRLEGFADERFVQRDWGQAYARYKQALEQAPDRIEPRMKLGWTLLASGQLGGAVGEFKRVARLNPEWPAQGGSLEEVYGPGSELVRTAILQKVAAWLQEDIRDADRLFLMGVVLHFNREPDQAAQFLQMADQIAGSPTHTQAFLDHLSADRGVQPAGGVVNRDQVQPAGGAQPAAAPQPADPSRPGAIVSPPQPAAPEILGPATPIRPVSKSPYRATMPSTETSPQAIGTVTRSRIQPAVKTPAPLPAIGSSRTIVPGSTDPSRTTVPANTLPASRNSSSGSTRVVAPVPAGTAGSSGTRSAVPSSNVDRRFNGSTRPSNAGRAAPDAANAPDEQGPELLFPGEPVSPGDESAADSDAAAPVRSKPSRPQLVRPQVINPTPATGSSLLPTPPVLPQPTPASTQPSPATAP